MSPKKLKNVTLKDFRKFLEYMGLKKIKIHGGHEKWSKKDMSRPVTIQTHIDPIPEFIVKNCFRNIGCKIEDFEEWINS